MTNNLNNMMCLDIYLSSLNERELKAINEKTKFNNSHTLPLLSWDIYSDFHFSHLQKLKRDRDILKVKNLSQKLNWSSDINALFKDEEFEAILITDVKQQIIWVNDGFTEMTGYSKKETLNRTPRFLQGPDSCSTAKERIRTKLLGIEPFKEVIVNYRKNKDVYKCEVKIFPLYSKKTTHFMALERRVI